MDEDLRWLDAVAVARLIRARKLSAHEVLAATLKRIEAVNPRLNAVVSLNARAARQQVAAIDRASRFAGQPYLLEDLGVSARDLPAANGSRFFRRAAAGEDCDLVTRLRASGLALLGRTNTAEMGIALTTKPVLWGACFNPWNPLSSPGGSSGGAGAAVAAGLTPFAHATDGCGSIRVSAALCGVFGFKPTRGRTPAGPAAGEGLNGMSAHHAITRSVRDSAALLDATHGAAAGDPYAAPASGGFEAATWRDPRVLRVAFTTKAPDQIPVDADCREAVAEAARLLEALGHRVVEIDAPAFDMARAISAIRAIWSSQLRILLDERAAQSGQALDGSNLEPLTWALAREADRWTAKDLAGAIGFLHASGRDAAATLAGFDVLLTPTVARASWPLGAPRTDVVNLEAHFRETFALSPFALQQNMSGAPAMSVPLYWTDAGQPVGVQFAAAPGEEAMLFALAAQLERAQPWTRRRPPLQ